MKRVSLTAFLIAAWVLLPDFASAQDVAQKVERLVTEALVDAFDVEPHAVTVEAYRLSQSVPDSFSVQTSWGTFPSGKRQVRLLPSSRGGLAGWALLRISRHDSVWVLQKTVRRGELLTRGDMTRRWMDLADVARAPITTLPDGSTVQAQRYLKKGRVLQAGDVEQPFETNVGDKVTLLYEQGRIRMMLEGKARQKGRPGDVIRVYSPTTKNTYRVELVSADHAKWIETL